MVGRGMCSPDACEVSGVSSSRHGNGEKGFMMNRSAFGSMGLSTAELLAQAKAFHERVTLGNSMHRPLRSDEQRVLAAFNYFVGSRAGEAPDCIPIEFGRMVFPSSSSGGRWWSGRGTDPIPFRDSASHSDRQLNGPRFDDRDDEVSEEFISMSVCLSVLEVADRFRLAS